jgi:hypothetical protein
MVGNRWCSSWYCIPPHSLRARRAVSGRGGAAAGRLRRGVAHHSLKGFWQTASRVDRYCASTNSGDSLKKSSSLWCVTCGPGRGQDAMQARKAPQPGGSTRRSVGTRVEGGNEEEDAPS